MKIYSGNEWSEQDYNAPYFTATLLNGSSLFAECIKWQSCSYWSIYASDSDQLYPDTLNTVEFELGAEEAVAWSNVFCDTAEDIDTDSSDEDDTDFDTACLFNCYAKRGGNWLYIYTINGFEDIELDWESVSCYNQTEVYCDENGDGMWNTSRRTRYENNDWYYVNEEYCDLEYFGKHGDFYCNGGRGYCNHLWPTTEAPTELPTRAPTQQEQWEFSFDDQSSIFSVDITIFIMVVFILAGICMSRKTRKKEEKIYKQREETMRSKTIPETIPEKIDLNTTTSSDPITINDGNDMQQKTTEMVNLSNPAPGQVTNGNNMNTQPGATTQEEFEPGQTEGQNIQYVPPTVPRQTTKSDAVSLGDDGGVGASGGNNSDNNNLEMDMMDEMNQDISKHDDAFTAVESRLYLLFFVFAAFLSFAFLLGVIFPKFTAIYFVMAITGYGFGVTLLSISCRDYQYLCCKKACKCFTAKKVSRTQRIKNNAYTLVVGTSRRDPTKKVVLEWSKCGARWNKCTKRSIRVFIVYATLYALYWLGAMMYVTNNDSYSCGYTKEYCDCRAVTPSPVTQVTPAPTNFGTTFTTANTGIGTTKGGADNTRVFESTECYCYDTWHCESDSLYDTLNTLMILGGIINGAFGVFVVLLSKLALAVCIIVGITTNLFLYFAEDLQREDRDRSTFAVAGQALAIAFWTGMIGILSCLILMFALSNGWKMKYATTTIIAGLLGVLDVTTDINVAVVWYQAGHSFWAIMQTVFVIGGQIFSALFIEDTKKMSLRQRLAGTPRTPTLGSTGSAMTAPSESTHHIESNASPSLSAAQISIRSQESVMSATSVRSSTGAVFNGDNGDDSNSSKKAACCQKVMVVLGLGRLWYGVRSWSEESSYDQFRVLKIWEMIFESFPTVALQFYITLKSRDQFSVSIIISLVTSFLSITFTALNILATDRTAISDLAKLHQNQQKSAQNRFDDNHEPGAAFSLFNAAMELKYTPDDVYDDAIELPQFIRRISRKSLRNIDNNEDFDENGNPIAGAGAAISKNSKKNRKQKNKKSKKHKKHHTSKLSFAAITYFMLVYLFIVTDFFVRITPVLILAVLLGDYWGTIFFLSCVVFGGIFEFIMLHRMLKRSYNKLGTKLKYFLAGIVTSSFYLLSTFGLDYLPTMIKFRVLFQEHFARIAISCIISGVSIWYQIKSNKGWQFFGTTVFFWIAVATNLICTWYIHSKFPKKKK